MNNPLAVMGLVALAVIAVAGGLVGLFLMLESILNCEDN